MDPFHLNIPPSSQASGNGYAYTTQSVNQDSCVPFSVQGPASNYFAATSQKSYTLLGYDGASCQGTGSAPSFQQSQFVTPPSSRSGHPYQQARLCHLADRAHARHSELSQPPFLDVPPLAPMSSAATPYNVVFGSRASNRCHQSGPAPLLARKFAPGPAVISGSQSSIMPHNASQNMNIASLMDSFSGFGQQFPSTYQMPSLLPCAPTDHADIEYAQHRYGGKRCLYQCRFDLSGSPCNKWIVGDRTRVLRHLRNHHHLQTGPAAPAVCRWEKCTHSRPMKQENLSRHVVMHLGVKWKCPHCRRLFSRDDAVHRHIERMVPGMDVTEAEVVPGCEARAIGDSELEGARIA